MRQLTRTSIMVLLLALTVISASFAASGSHVLATGQFEGRSDHTVTGTVSLLAIGDAVVVVLGPDFELDGAPDPKVALGSDGYDSKTLQPLLVSKEGAQVFELPASVRADGYNEVWIWCEKFDVPLGVASLRGSSAEVD